MLDARGKRQRGLFFSMENSPRVNAASNSCALFLITAGWVGGVNCDAGELFKSDWMCARKTVMILRSSVCLHE
jgi:hypothetical protein